VGKRPFTAKISFTDSVCIANELAMGWCSGRIKERNTDARSYKMVDGKRATVNFIIHYEIDDEEAKTVLRADEYGGDEDMSWVLLAEEAEGDAPAQ
jgi:hypothetical protein